MVEIIPSIIARSYEEFERLIRTIEPYTQRVQLDVMDGRFVNNNTIQGFDEVARIDTPLRFDVHLMTVNPEDSIKDWYDEKAERFIIHMESACDHEGIIDELHAREKGVGLAINPETAIEILFEHLERADFVQFMTVDPGAYGGTFLPEVLEKIKKLRMLRPDVKIMADGGVRPETLPLLVEAGCDMLICGSYLFKNPEPGIALNGLKSLANSK